MNLQLDAQGINIYLKIKGYKPSDSDTWDSQWCNCDFSFYSGTWLNYHKEDDEVLLSCEVEELADKLSQLLNDELSEQTEILCIEPDFIFTLFPKRDLRKDPAIHASNQVMKLQTSIWNGRFSFGTKDSLIISLL